MSRKRNYPVTIWFDEKELISLKNKMSKMACNPGFKRSDYIRNCSLDKDITIIPGIRDLIIEVKSIINNLNNITCKVNSGEVKSIGSNLTEIKEDLKEAWTKLSKTLKKI
ncbi:MAG: plasmid mobilization protein [Candidatus Humimicrobiaceae bacterium]